jgi:hypothetical protein
LILGVEDPEALVVAHQEPSAVRVELEALRVLGLAVQVDEPQALVDARARQQRTPGAHEEERAQHDEDEAVPGELEQREGLAGLRALPDVRGGHLARADRAAILWCRGSKIRRRRPWRTGFHT